MKTEKKFPNVFNGKDRVAVQKADRTKARFLKVVMECMISYRLNNLHENLIN